MAVKILATGRWRFVPILFYNVGIYNVGRHARAERTVEKMMRSEEQEKKKNMLDKLPKLGKASQLMLLVGVFLIIFIPLSVIYRQQPVKWDELKHELSLLQTILTAPTAKKEMLQAQIRQVDAEMEVATTLYPKLGQSVNIMDGLLELADANDISVSTTRTMVTEKEEGETSFDVVTFEMYLKGQVPKFQNFILALGDWLPASKVSTVNITIADKEGDEDTAILKIDIACNEGG